MRTLSHPLHSGSLSWLPLLPCCAPPPCLLCSPLSLLVRLPRSVCLFCSSPCLLALLGAPFAHPLLSHPPAPPYGDFTSPYDVDCPTRGWLVTALLPPPWRAPPSAQGAAPALFQLAGTLWRGGLFAMARSAYAAFGGCCSARTSWSPCALLCVLLGLVSLPCVGRPCAQLLCCVCSSQFGALFSSGGALTAASVRCRGGQPPPPPPASSGLKCQGAPKTLRVPKQENGLVPVHLF